MNELETKERDALEAKNDKLMLIQDQLQAKLAAVDLKCGDLAQKNEELKRENEVLRAQMDVVRIIFEGRDRK